MVRKTSEMVEAGILAAIAVLFAILGTYLPVLGVIFNFLWSVPVAVCGMRNGLRWSIMTLIVAGAVIGSLLGPVQALSVMAMFGLLGLALGECMYRGYTPAKTLVYSSAATFVSILLSMGLAMLVMGTNPVDIMFSGLEEALNETQGYYRAAGMSEEQIAAAVQSNKDMIELIRLILPGSLIVCSPIIAFANYMGSRKVLSKMGVAFAPLPPFKNWRVSEYLIWPFALSMGFMATYPDAPKLAFEIAVNIQTVTSVAFLFQGWAVIYWWLEKNGKPLWLGAVSVVLALSVQLVSTFIVLLGAFESVFDNRNLKERSL